MLSGGKDLYADDTAPVSLWVYYIIIIVYFFIYFWLVLRAYRDNVVCEGRDWAFDG